MESKDTVWKSTVENGYLFIWFRSHAGIFRVRASHTELRKAIAESLDQAKEISFTFDRNLEILSIHPS